MQKRNQQFHLSDGRKLGFDEFGVSNGTPLFYFHGSPSSRLECQLYLDDALLQSQKVRLIAVDRPGMGQSDFKPNRRMLDWTQDVVELADHLSIDRFAILAYSLGGPYGLACACAIQHRLTSVGIVSGSALFTEPELIKNVNEGTRNFLFLPREKPWLSRFFLWIVMGVMPRIAPNRFIMQASSLLPPPDRAIVAGDSSFQLGFIKMVREAMKQGVRGVYTESLLAVTDWGFRLQDITMPVVLWHGEDDQNVPVEMARFAAAAIPNCEAMIFPEEGHLSLFKRYAKEILVKITD